MKADKANAPVHLIMNKEPYYKLNKDPEIISGFRRTIGEIEWLLLTLVLFFLVVGNVDERDKPIVISASCLYAGFVLAFQYWNFFRETRQWKIAFQTWAMILFISWLIWFTGKLQSPLFNLYLLPVLASAITLGKTVTLLEVGLIFSIFMLLVRDLPYNPPGTLFTMVGSSDVLMLFFPMLLVAYISTMLTSDIQNGYNRLRNISDTDELTKLFNHRAFKAMSDKFLKQAARQKLNLSFLMIDLDNLKTVNDRFGYEAGNLLLMNIAQHLLSALREGDVAARYGGDEFVVLLANCGAKEAHRVGHRILDEFKTAKIRHQGNTIELSASIGIATYPEHGFNLDTLIDNADHAMYASKRNGKGMITIYHSGLFNNAA